MYDNVKLTDVVQVHPRQLDRSTTLTLTLNLDIMHAPAAYAQFHISSFKKLA